MQEITLFSSRSYNSSVWILKFLRITSRFENMDVTTVFNLFDKTISPDDSSNVFLPLRNNIDEFLFNEKIIAVSMRNINEVTVMQS